MLKMYFCNVMEDLKCAISLITFKGRSRDDLFAAKCSCVRQGELLPLTLLLDRISFLLCSIVLLPIICLRFLFLRKAMIGDD